MDDDKVIYVYDKKLQEECDRLPTMLERASMVQDLINCYELLSCDEVTLVKSKPATEDELKYFHSTAYLDFIKQMNNSDDFDCFDEEKTTFGLDYDCPLLPKLYDLIRILAGGSLTAAKLLTTKQCRVAINWFGGWHHAQRDKAEGFCYVNDVVLAIQKLTESFTRILYIDLDIHHGDGVQNAFELSKKILTLSFHKYSPGFYPGTGGLDDIGYQKGKYHALNVPLLEGCGDKTYLNCFESIFSSVVKAFEPCAIVVQCGADGINGDPVGQWNLTPKGMGQCLQLILNHKLPTLVLGGGGYNFPNTARYWTHLTSVILGKTLEVDIPHSCEYFTEYGPTYELEIEAGYQKDSNTEQYIESVIRTILDYCNYIKVN